MNKLPIIRLELEGFRHSIVAMLTEHAAKMDVDIRNAVESYLTSANVAEVIAGTVRATINEQIRASIESHYKYGEGRKIIDSEVTRVLAAMDTKEGRSNG